MRKEARNQYEVNRFRQQGYHEGGWGHGELYATMGFNKNAYWTSDRPIALDEHWQRPNNEPLKGYGLEIEMECSGINNDNALVAVLENIVLRFFPKNLFKHQSDGSLGGNSSDEAITGVMTKAFIRNNYRAFKAMFEMMPDYGISCGGAHCGMHVNISNALLGKTAESQADNARKLLYFVNKNYDLCVSLFARNPQATRYCGRMSQYTDKNACKNADMNDMPSAHAYCCNWSHFRAGRVELRLVGGQKNYASFRNTMESVFHVISAVNNLGWEDIDDLTKVFKGCNRYVYDRLTKCRNDGVLSQDIVNAVEPTVDREEILL